MEIREDIEILDIELTIEFDSFSESLKKHKFEAGGVLLKKDVHDHGCSILESGAIRQFFKD